MLIVKPGAFRTGFAGARARQQPPVLAAGAPNPSKTPQPTPGGTAVPRAGGGTAVPGTALRKNPPACPPSGDAPWWPRLIPSSGTVHPNTAGHFLPPAWT